MISTSCGCLDVSCSDDAFAVFAQAQCDFIAVVQFEHHAFEVQQDVDHIFLHTIDGRVFVQHTSDGDFGGGSSPTMEDNNTRRKALPSVWP
jgi:hypothetical protein